MSRLIVVAIIGYIELAHHRMPHKLLIR